MIRDRSAGLAGGLGSVLPSAVHLQLDISARLLNSPRKDFLCRSSQRRLDPSIELSRHPALHANAGATARSCRNFIRKGTSPSFTFVPAWVIGTEDHTTQLSGVWPDGRTYFCDADAYSPAEGLRWFSLLLASYGTSPFDIKFGCSPGAELEHAARKGAGIQRAMRLTPELSLGTPGIHRV
jgi:hypothetical protein